MRIVVAALLSLCGCFFYAKDTTKSQVVSTDLDQVPLQTFPTTIQVGARDATLRIFVSTPRTCRRDEVTNIAITHGKELSMTIVDDGKGYGLLLGILLAPITLPISGLIAGISLSAHDDYVTYDRKVKSNGVQPCPDIRARPIQLTLASGAVQAFTSQPDGTLEVLVPPDEPDQGVIAVASPGATTVPLAYFKTYEACEAARAAAFEQALATPARLPAVPRCDVLTSNTVREREHGWSLAIAALDAASRGDCAAMLDKEEGIRNLVPQLHGPIYASPVATGCAQREAMRRARMTDCQLRRAEAMRAAQTIRNPNQRGEALRRIPQCK